MLARVMSDYQMDAELLAKKSLYAAVAAMRSAIMETNYVSVLRDIDIKEFDAFVHDTIPDEKSWDEAISLARRG